MTDQNSHALTTLQTVIRRSVAQLKVHAEALRETPSKVLMDRVMDTATTLSSAVAQLARQVDVSALVAPSKPAPPGKPVDAMLALVSRMDLYVKHGPCCVCGGVLSDFD